MRLLLSAGLVVGGAILLFADSSFAQQSFDCQNCNSIGNRDISPVNNWQRRRGRWYSSGYHYKSPGCLPHTNWDPYQDLLCLNGSVQQPAYQHIAPHSYPNLAEPVPNGQYQPADGNPLQQRSPDSVLDRKDDFTPPTPKKPNRNSEPSPSDLKVQPKKKPLRGGVKESDGKTTLIPPVRNLFRQTSSR